MDTSDIIKIYVGSDIEANYISDLLEENGIKCMLRNIMNEGLTAGWASASTDNATNLYVSTADQEKAKNIIESYLNSK